MGILLVILQITLGLAFLGAGGQKLAGSEPMVGVFDRFGYPRWFMYFTGAVEVTGAVGVLAGIFAPALALLGALLLAATMIGALFTHARVGDPAYRMGPPAALLALAVVVMALV